MSWEEWAAQRRDFVSIRGGKAILFALVHELDVEVTRFDLSRTPGKDLLASRSRIRPGRSRITLSTRR